MDLNNPETLPQELREFARTMASKEGTALLRNRLYSAAHEIDRLRKENNKLNRGTKAVERIRYVK